MPEQRKLENVRFSAKIEKGGPYRVIRTGYQSIRLQESRSVSVAINKSRILLQLRTTIYSTNAVDRVISEWVSTIDLCYEVRLVPIFGRLDSFCFRNLHGRQDKGYNIQKVFGNIDI